MTNKSNLWHETLRKEYLWWRTAGVNYDTGLRSGKTRLILSTLEWLVSLIGLAPRGAFFELLLSDVVFLHLGGSYMVVTLGQTILDKPLKICHLSFFFFFIHVLLIYLLSNLTFIDKYRYLSISTYQ